MSNDTRKLPVDFSRSQSYLRRDEILKFGNLGNVKFQIFPNRDFGIASAYEPVFHLSHRIKFLSYDFLKTCKILRVEVRLF